ncbi:hypothetical protein [Thermosulfidibacter takaii]|uniref:hypothetical protein n=1 Tax=Thermosulfidibacter takaii TaxID=412593 RepID=UPI000837DF9D|nr:hypothetical protein [Thermosulfidibacter takaii]
MCKKIALFTVLCLLFSSVGFAKLFQKSIKYLQHNKQTADELFKKKNALPAIALNKPFQEELIKTGN